MVNWNFPTEVKFMGYNRYKYNGAFPDKVEQDIKNLVAKSKNVLHLFSGVSKIGQVRVDIERPEATHNMDVFEFIKTKEAQKQWEWCILDPPYNIYNPDQDLKDYGIRASVSASVPKRNALADFFRKYVKNVLWLDHCAPLPQGFIRKKIWFYFPGGYRTIRILSWLQRANKHITAFTETSNSTSLTSAEPKEFNSDYA